MEVARVSASLGFAVEEKGAKDYGRLVKNARSEASVPIVAKLDADVNKRAFGAYTKELEKAEAKAKRKQAYIAHLGADFDNRAFNAAERELKAYEREVARAEAANARLSGSNMSLGASARSAGGGMGGLGIAMGLVKFEGMIAGAGLALQAIGALSAGVVSLTSALGPLTGLLGTIPAFASSAAQALGTIKLASGGVNEAIKAGLTEQTKGSTNAAAALKQQGAATNAVRTAKVNLTSAQQTAKIAQESLTTARFDATRQLEDMSRAAKNSRLDEEDAVIALRRAREALAKTMRDPKASGLDIDEANLAVRQARQNLSDVRAQGERARQDNAKAQKLGVDKAPNVVAAERAATSARRAASAAAQQVTQAQNNVTAATTKSTASASAYQTALAKLAPAQRQFVKYVIGLQPEFLKLKQAAGENLFGGVEAGTRSAMKNFPVLERGIARTSGVLGGLVKKAGELVGSKAFGKDLDTQMRRNDVTIRRTGDGALALSNAVRHITIAAGPLVDWITKSVVAFTHLIERQAEAGRKSGDLARFFEQTRIVVSRLVHIAGDLAGAFINIGKAAYPVGKDLLRVLTLNADKFREWTGSAKGQNSIKKYFEDARPAIDEMGRLFVAMVKMFVRLGNSRDLAPLIKQIRVELLPALERILTTITKNLGPGLVDVVTKLFVLFSHLSTGPLAQLTDMLGLALELLNKLIEKVPLLGTALSTLLLFGGLSKILGMAAAITGMKKIISLTGLAKKEAVTLGAIQAGAGAGGVAGVIGRGRAGVGGALAPARGVYGTGRALGAGPLTAGVGAAPALARGVGSGLAGAGSAGLAALGGLPGVLIGLTAATLALGSANKQNRTEKAGALGDTFAQNLTGIKDPKQLELITKYFDSIGKKGKDAKWQTGEFDKALQAVYRTAGTKKIGGQDGLDALAKKFKELSPTVQKVFHQLSGFKITFPKLDLGNVLDGNAVAQLLSNFNRLRKGGITSIEDLRANMRFNLQKIKEGFVEGTPDWADAMTKNIKIGIKSLKDGMADGAVSAKSGTRQIARFVRENMTLVKNNLDGMSREGKEKLASNFHDAATAVHDQMERAHRFTKSGMEQVRKYLADELQVYGFSLSEAKNIVKTGDPQGNKGRENSPIGRATGGMASPFGGSSRDDHVLVDPSGRPVAALSGTEGIINAPQMDVVDYALGGMSELGLLPSNMGGLDKLWGSGLRHYATGGMIGAANKLEKAGFPYVWGGGHQKSPAPFGPMDCSGAVSFVLQHGGVNIPTMTSGSLEHAGKPGAGEVTVFANPEHTFMRIGARYFGTSGTNPGGGAGWFPDPGSAYKGRFTQRHFDGSEGGIGSVTVPAPTVKGGGVVGRVVNRVLAAGAAGASKLLDAASMSGVGTGQVGDPGPGAEPGVISGFRRAIRARKAQPKERLALWEAGIVESGLRNLPGGDRDSVGSLQQRPSQGWTGLTNPYRAALEFLQHAIAKRPWGGSAGALAQAVQGSAFPLRYDAVAAQARRYMRGGGALVRKFASGGSLNARNNRLAFLQERASARAEHQTAVNTNWQEAANRGAQNAVARGETGVASFEIRIQNAERQYGQMDRKFGQSNEVFLVEHDDGSATVDSSAVGARVGELDALIAKREEIKKLYLDYKAAVIALIEQIKEAIARVKRSLAAAKGKSRAKDRTGYREAIATYSTRIQELGGTLNTLEGDIVDQDLDLSELANERASVAGTQGRAATTTAAPAGLTPDEQAQLSQVETLRAIVARGTFIDTMSAGVLGGTLNPKVPGGVEWRDQNPNTVGAAVNPALATKAAAMGVDLNAPVGTAAGAGGGGTFVQNNYMLAPSDPNVLTEVAKASNAGNSYLGTVSSPRTTLGV